MLLLHKRTRPRNHSLRCLGRLCWCNGNGRFFTLPRCAGHHWGQRRDRRRPQSRRRSRLRMRQDRTGYNRRGSRFPLSSMRRGNDLPFPCNHGSEIKAWGNKQKGDSEVGRIFSGGKTHVVMGSNRAARKRSSETRALGNRKSETLPLGSIVKYTSTLPIRFSCFCRSRSYTACR